MKVPGAILHDQGVHLIIYLDEILIRVKSMAVAQHNVEVTFRLLHQLVLTPAQR